MNSRPARGFSLIELLVVVALLMVISAMAFPTIMNAVSATRLRSSMATLCGLIQDCRSSAIKNNQMMSVHFGILASGGVAYVKQAADTSALATTDPQVELGGPVAKTTSLTGSGAPTALNSSVLGFTPQNLAYDPSFNPRGLPCYYSGGNCTTNVGFVFYFNDTRPIGWAAVSVSPAGRIKVWYWNGTAWGD